MWVAGPVHLICTSKHWVPIFEKVAFGYTLTLRISAEESEGGRWTAYVECITVITNPYENFNRKYVSIFSALSRCTKRVADQQMHFILYCGQQHVLDIPVAIFRVTSVRTGTQI
jgi:hypothetical protein